MGSEATAAGGGVKEAERVAAVEKMEQAAREHFFRAPQQAITGCPAVQLNIVVRFLLELNIAGDVSKWS